MGPQGHESCPPRQSHLAPEQAALIPAFRHRWQSVALSCAPLDERSATLAVHDAYALAGLSPPEIIFCDSPYAALDTDTFRAEEAPQAGTLWRRLSWSLGDALALELRRRYSPPLLQELEDSLKKYLASGLWHSLESSLVSRLEGTGASLVNGISPVGWAGLCCFFDFCFTVLDCPHERAKWQAFRAVVEQCGWLFPYKQVCLICRRPVELRLDTFERLHGEGEPAIAFADGWQLFAWHGTAVRDEYGSTHPSAWQPHWILEEDDPELRRVLIEGIGYRRLALQLPCEVLDTWGSYSLLRLGRVDVEPMHLLRSLDPATGAIDLQRVPPEFTSARAAACWVQLGRSAQSLSA